MSNHQVSRAVGTSKYLSVLLVFALFTQYVLGGNSLSSNNSSSGQNIQNSVMVTGNSVVSAQKISMNGRTYTKNDVKILKKASNPSVVSNMVVRSVDSCLFIGNSNSLDRTANPVVSVQNEEGSGSSSSDSDSGSSSDSSIGERPSKKSTLRMGNITSYNNENVIVDFANKNARYKKQDPFVYFVRLNEGCDFHSEQVGVDSVVTITRQNGDVITVTIGLNGVHNVEARNENGESLSSPDLINGTQ